MAPVPGPLPSPLEKGPGWVPCHSRLRRRRSAPVGLTRGLPKEQSHVPGGWTEPSPSVFVTVGPWFCTPLNQSVPLSLGNPDEQLSPTQLLNSHQPINIY